MAKIPGGQAAGSSRSSGELVIPLKASLGSLVHLARIAASRSAILSFFLSLLPSLENSGSQSLWSRLTSGLEPSQRVSGNVPSYTAEQRTRQPYRKKSKESMTRATTSKIVLSLPMILLDTFMPTSPVPRLQAGGHGVIQHTWIAYVSSPHKHPGGGGAQVVIRSVPRKNSTNT